MFGEGREWGPEADRLGREWTVIEKYQSKTRQGPGRGSYYVNPVRQSTGGAQMHFFCIGNAPLLSKPLSPATGASYLRTDSSREGKEGIIKWSMWPLQACFVMLSGLWDKQPRPVRRFQFLYMRDEDLALLLAFTFLMLLYFCLAPNIALPVYYKCPFMCLLQAGWPAAASEQLNLAEWLQWEIEIRWRGREKEKEGEERSRINAHVNALPVWPDEAASSRLHKHILSIYKLQH